MQPRPSTPPTATHPTHHHNQRHDDPNHPRQQGRSRCSHIEHSVQNLHCQHQPRHLTTSTPHPRSQRLAHHNHQQDEEKDDNPDPADWAKNKLEHRRGSMLRLKVRPPGCFINISVTTPIARALKNHSSWNFLEAPTGILRPLPDPDGGFTSETATRRFRK